MSHHTYTTLPVSPTNKFPYKKGMAEEKYNHMSSDGFPKAPNSSNVVLESAKGSEAIATKEINSYQKYSFNKK